MADDANVDADELVLTVDLIPRGAAHIEHERIELEESNEIEDEDEEEMNLGTER